MRHTKVLIIGSGPAGLTAAIYASRANLSPLLVEGGPPNLAGGQLMITSDVENFPGFAEGIMGPVLMEEMRKQAERVGTEFVSENIVRLDLSRRPFTAFTDGQLEIAASTAIVATGASAKWLGLPEEALFYGKGVSACATCDGFFFRNKHVIVVGGGDTALEEAIFLTRLASKVTVIHRRNTFRASAIMQARAKSNPKIEFVLNVAVSKLHDLTLGRFTAVTVRNLATDEERDIEADGFFVAIGHKPNTELVRGIVEMDDLGYIVTRPGTPITSVPGLFAAGDVQDKVYRQAVTAAGSGCMAAIEAERYLEEHNG